MPNPFDDAPADKADFINRALGKSRTGTVSLRDFDKGVITTLNATVQKGASGQVEYFLTIPGVIGPPGDPGVPVIFSHPEDVFAKKRLPCVVVQRDSLTPAMSRWQGPEQIQYRVPSLGAEPVTVTKPDGTVLSGFTKYESLKQAMPFDIGYTITIYATGRDAQDRLHASKIFAYIASIYKAYSLVVLTDSIDDVRSYQAYMEGITDMSDILEIAERMIGFSFTLRVEAELDLDIPQDNLAVTAPAQYTWLVKK